MINILKSSSRKTWNQQGITLLELLVTLAIIAILATIAYPSYLNQVRKSKRTIAKSALLDAANREEQYYFSNRSYTSKLKVDLNYPEDPQCFNDQQAQIACDGPDTVYEMTAAVTGCGTDPCFIITATPKHDQANDTACGNFTLTSSNAKGAAGSDCW